MEAKTRVMLRRHLFAGSRPRRGLLAGTRMRSWQMAQSENKFAQAETRPIMAGAAGAASAQDEAGASAVPEVPKVKDCCQCRQTTANRFYLRNSFLEKHKAGYTAATAKFRTFAQNSSYCALDGQTNTSHCSIASRPDHGADCSMSTARRLWRWR